MQELPFHVEIWQKDFNAPFQTVAKAISFGMADAVFEELVSSRPDEFIRLRIGIRVMKQHPERSEASL